MQLFKYEIFWGSFKEAHFHIYLLYIEIFQFLSVLSYYSVRGFHVLIIIVDEVLYIILYTLERNIYCCE